MLTVGTLMFSRLLNEANDMQMFWGFFFSIPADLSKPTFPLQSLYCTKTTLRCHIVLHAFHPCMKT